MNPTKSSPRDVFLHLLGIVTLYISAVSFGTLLFQYVNRFFPDALVDMYSSPSGSIRWAIASLLIVFPVYVWLSWFLQRDVVAYPEKRELKVRKWLLYFTLFLAAIVIIIDLVVLIYNFLGGELSMRFVLKILSVLFIAAAVFGYYLWNLRSNEMASRNPRMRFFVWGVLLIVAAATIGGFFLVGSPFAERLRRFDDERASGLQTLQSQIIYYWQRKNILPQSLDDLRDPLSGFVPPVDPETQESYEYRATGTLKFELCAAFKTASNQTAELRGHPPVQAYPGGKPGQDSWSHEAGRTCFERTIDPELYQLEKPTSL